MIFHILQETKCIYSLNQLRLSVQSGRVTVDFAKYNWIQNILFKQTQHCLQHEQGSLYMLDELMKNTIIDEGKTVTLEEYFGQNVINLAKKLICPPQDWVRT